MLVDLIKYEFLKKWKTSRYVLFGYVLLQILLVIVSRIFFCGTATWREYSSAMATMAKASG